MRKHILAVILSLFLCLFFSQSALASITWQIDWQENGTLKEKVNLSGQEIPNAGASWQMSQSGNETVLSRSVESWGDYNNLSDKLPLQANVKNLLCCKVITLIALPETQNSALYSNLDRDQTMRLEMNVPAIVLDSSASGKNKSAVYWEIENPGKSFSRDFIFRVIMVDGFGLGITILGLGVISLAFFFVKRMRKVNQIIDETYSLDNIIIEDEEDNH